MTDRDTCIKEMDALIDSYHANDKMSVLQLLDLRRNLAIWCYYLSATVKDGYKNKAWSYVLRKYQYSREIVAALTSDATNGGKRRPMNQIEAQTAALDHVLQSQKAEVTAEAEYEDTVARIKACNNVLQALSQEIADGRYEKNNPHHTNQAV